MEMMIRGDKKYFSPRTGKTMLEISDRAFSIGSLPTLSKIITGALEGDLKSPFKRALE